MRRAPIALRDAYDERRMMGSARDEALITHFDPRAWTGSVAACLLIDHCCAMFRRHRRCAVLSSGLRREPRAAAEAVATSADVRPTQRADELPTNGYVLDTLRIAVWALLANTSFEDTVVAAVNFGGDADTQGAVAGAFAGAHYGVDAIPAGWLQPLMDREELAKLAGRCRSLPSTSEWWCSRSKDGSMDRGTRICPPVRPGSGGVPRICRISYPSAHILKRQQGVK